MNLIFSCGICGKQENLELKDKNKTYIIGRDIDGLDIHLCSDEKSTLSRIQAHIKWDRNSWRIFDGWPPETISKQGSQMAKPASMAGTFLKRNGEIRMLQYGVGEEMRTGDTVFFVVTAKSDRASINTWLKTAGTDALALFYKYDGFVFPADVEHYEGFKYKVVISSDEEITETKSGSQNLYAPKSTTQNLEPGKIYYNACVAFDIRLSTEADLETQRNYWIPQFNSIFDELLVKYSNYLLILVGDGAYVCFMGERENEDVNFTFANKFIERLHIINAENRKKKVQEWKVRVAVNNGKDLLSQVNIAGQKSLNVYGNTITITSRLMSHAKSEGDEIIVGIPFHQEFNNKKYYKSNFQQSPGETVDKNGVLHHYYIYKKI
jgi:hypothetical protein